MKKQFAALIATTIIFGTLYGSDKTLPKWYDPQRNPESGAHFFSSHIFLQLNFFRRINDELNKKIADQHKGLVCTEAEGICESKKDC